MEVAPSRVCRACLLVLAFTTSLIQGKVRVVDNKGMKVFVLDEGAYSDLQYFLDDLDVKRNQLYSAFPGSSKSTLRNENLVELEDRVPVVIGIPKRSPSLAGSAGAGGAELEIVLPESGGDQMQTGEQQQQQEKLVLNRKSSDEWMKNPSQSYYPSSLAAAAPAAGSNYAGHQQSGSYYGMPAVDDSPAAAPSSDSHSYYEPDRRYEYAVDQRSESTAADIVSKPESPVRSFIRRWSRY